MTSVLKELDELFRCFICFERPKEANFLSCCGSFGCEGCLKKWFAAKQFCPACRNKDAGKHRAPMHFLTKATQLVGALMEEKETLTEKCDLHSAEKANRFCQDCIAICCSECLRYNHNHHNTGKLKRLLRHQDDLELICQLAENHKDDRPRYNLFLLKRASAQNYARAQYQLAKVLHQGLYCEVDNPAAYALLCKSADQGYAPAQCLLGCWYMNGPAQHDPVEAARLFQLAATQGHIPGQRNLALCYYSGNGIAQDYEEATRLLQLGASQGDANSQYTLAQLYEDGEGVESCQKRAYKLYSLASKQGHRLAQQAVQEYQLVEQKLWCRSCENVHIGKRIHVSEDSDGDAISENESSSNDDSSDNNRGRRKRVRRMTGDSSDPSSDSDSTSDYG